MTRMSKLALIATVAAVTVASPALAQSFNPRDGTGNVMPLQYQGSDGGRTAWMSSPASRGNAQIAVRRNGAEQFAVRKSGSEQIAVRHGHSPERIASHRTVHHGAV
jgi:hypothetical protein